MLDSGNGTVRPPGSPARPIPHTGAPEAVDELAYTRHHRCPQALPQRASDIVLRAILEIAEEIDTDVELDHRSPLQGQWIGITQSRAAPAEARPGGRCGRTRCSARTGEGPPGQGSTGRRC